MTNVPNKGGEANSGSEFEPTRLDRLTAEERSRHMARIKSKNTKPEMAVRRLVHSLGYRYRLHDARLPGKPDLVFAGRRKVIFVHGCFWHSHRGCRRHRPPKSRTEFWLPKLERNRRRDILAKRRLTLLGWRYLVIWECEIKPNGLDPLAERITLFLDAA